MKKILTLIALVAIVVSCGNKNSTQNESTAQDESFIKEEAAVEDAAKDFIKKMYNERLFEDDQFLNAHCSPILLGKLRDAYDYDDEQGLASWLFRSEDQDGPSDRHEIIKVESEGNNWYKYEFYDMGTKGSHRIKLILGTNDEIIIDDLE